MPHGRLGFAHEGKDGLEDFSGGDALIEVGFYLLGDLGCGLGSGAEAEAGLYDFLFIEGLF